MNMEDIKVEPLVRKREGMQPVTVCNDIRVTHLPTGLVIEVPHEFTRSQNQSLKTAIAMLEAVVPNVSETPFHKLANEWLNTIDLNNHDIPDRMKIQREVYRQCAKDLKALMARMQKVGGIRTTKQDELAEKHGTPEQFEKAVWKAYSDLFISQEEAASAIRKYRNEWESASIK